MRSPSPASPSSATRFTIQPVNGGAILTMKKRIPASRFKTAVQRRLNEIRESYSKRPSYKVVTDIFGNRYYVDNREQLRAQMSQEMQNIDTKPIARQVSKSAFKDYELELEYSGLVLRVRSGNDAVDREFEFGGVIEDFSLAGCTMESDDVAVLRIKVTLQSENSNSNNNQEEVKRVEIRDKSEVEHKQKSTKAATTTTTTTSKVDGKVQKSQKVSPASSHRVNSNEPKKIRRHNADHIKAKKLAEQAAAAEKARLERIQQQQQEEVEKKRRQEEQQRLAKEEERKKREQLLKEQAEYQRQLVEEERQLRAERQRRAMAAAAAATAESSAVNSSDSDVSDAESVSSVGDDEWKTGTGPALSKTVSPVLEDVEDEEMERYNESVRRNSGSRSIIEDI